MAAHAFGTIILVPFPFTDQSAAKQRPAVVVSSPAYHRARHDLILMPITSQLRVNAFGDLLVQDWQAARLLIPSAVKPVPATLAQSLVIKLRVHRLYRQEKLQVAVQEASGVAFSDPYPGPQSCSCSEHKTNGFW